MEKFVVIGVETSIGAALAAAFQDRCDVSGISFGPVVEGNEFASRPVRRGDNDQLALAIERAEPDVLIYAGSLSASSWDLPAADPTWQLDLEMAEGLTTAARRAGAKLIGLSSDVVFSGPKMFHDETAATTSAHPAAAAVLQWEQTLLTADALVARTCAYGWAPAGAEPGLVERTVHALRAGRPVPVDGQRFATPIFAADLAPLLLQAAGRNLTGLFHVSGAERTNSFRLAGGLASLLGLPLSRTMDSQSGRREDASWLLETSLDSRRARRALDLPLPMLAEGLGRFVDAEPGAHLTAALCGPIEQAA